MLTNKTLTAIVANLVALTAVDVTVWKQNTQSYSKDDFTTTVLGRTYKISSGGFFYINDVMVGSESNIIKPLQTEVYEQVFGRPALAELNDAVLLTTQVIMEEMMFQLLVDDLLNSITGDYKNPLDYAARTANYR